MLDNNKLIYNIFFYDYKQINNFIIFYLSKSVVFAI